jgi:hypothetical protein
VIQPQPIIIIAFVETQMSFEHVTSELINVAAPLAREGAARELEAVAMRLNDTLTDGAVHVDLITNKMRRLLWVVDSLVEPAMVEGHVKADLAAWESLVSECSRGEPDLSPLAISTVHLLIARLANDAPTAA